MSDKLRERSLSPVHAGLIFGKHEPSPLGKVTITYLGNDGSAATRKIVANRAERRKAKRDAVKESLRNYRELRRQSKNG